MTRPALDEFVRRLDGLDPDRLTQFVADLYAARGFETVVTDTDRFAARPRDDADTVWVGRSLPDAPVAADVVVVAHPTDVETLADGTNVVDARALHRMALYAIADEQFAALSADYFDGVAGNRGRDPGRVDDGGRRRLRVPSPPPAVGVIVDRLSVRLLAALAASLLVVVAAAAVGLDGGPVAGDGRETTVTPVSLGTVDRGPAAPTPTRGLPVCPPPPRDARPASLRPVPVQAAVSTGLESWEHVLSVNATAFYGPSPLSIPWSPAVRHESTYLTPEGVRVVLTVDRWNDSSTAAQAGRALAAEYGLAAVWGEYTLAVTHFASGGNASVEPLRRRATSLLLMSEVVTPDGVKLGRRCLDEVLVERGG